ncbi:lytic transglycosylase domain-containing protein [Roseicyclus sp.]|uniref:lytic transglycosylase domain-containing protein n=1 Tax=Roseicyclus sp. TaxID=1914329 RepID=UPI003F6D877E
MTNGSRRYRAIRSWAATALACICALSTVGPSRAAPELCDAAAITAARETGVPRDVLLTLTRVETGRGGSEAIPDPWPWTLNMAGRGAFYPDAQTALGAAAQAVADGMRNIDIGCFQLNFRWHGAAFPGLSEMLDPLQNARYAAAFLHDLHDEFGDWVVAAGVFHSRTPEHASRYLDRFHQIRAALPPAIARQGPRPLTMATRPALAAARNGGLIRGAARPLWERR